MTNTRFLLFLKALKRVLTCSQHAVCTHSLRLEDLSPHHTPHLSLLKSKHHPWSRLSLFPPRPSNERAHSPFPPSLSRPLALSFPVISLWLTFGQMDVNLSIFYLVRNKRLQPRLCFFTKPSSSSHLRACKHSTRWDWLRSFSGSLSCCWGLVTAPNTWLICLTHATHSRLHILWVQSLV